MIVQQLVHDHATAVERSILLEETAKLAYKNE